MRVLWVNREHNNNFKNKNTIDLKITTVIEVILSAIVIKSIIKTIEAMAKASSKHKDLLCKRTIEKKSISILDEL